MANSVSLEIREPHSDYHQLPETWHPVLKRVYAARGVRSQNDIDYRLQGMASPTNLGGLVEASNILATSIREDQRILICGDFDADGATSCALCVRALRSMGAKHVDYRVPDRFIFGYGLSAEFVESIYDLKADVIVTVDNGISSVDGVALAESKGIKVIVTDHHLPGEVLPPASALVNPNLPGDTFISKNLAGVGVAFYLMAGVRKRLKELDWFVNRAQPNLADYLDLVALGTVADLVILDYNNRLLVEQGLMRIRAGKASAGIQALIEVSLRNSRLLSSQDLGFSLGPRINAAGRLDDISVGVECLITDNPQRAQQIAEQLNSLNIERRDMQLEMQKQADHLLEGLEYKLQNDQKLSAISLFDAQWHQGIVGLLASKIKDKAHRPVFAFAPDSNASDTLKGSGRSIKGLHLRDVLADMNRLDPDLMIKFGGHAMAAGLSIKHNKLEVFKSLFEQCVTAAMAGKSMDGVIETDGKLNSQDINLDLAEQFQSAGPWGQGFPEPCFHGQFKLIEQRIVGGRHLKLVLQASDGGGYVDAIAFNRHPEELPEGQVPLHIVYHLQVNEFRNKRTLQLLITHMLHSL